MTERKIGTRDEWLAARAELLECEKAHTKAGDELARMRRELPWVPLEKEYTFQSEHGPKTLAELFAGRSQLVVYHFMFGPQYEARCPACSLTADGFDGTLPHLEARDVTMICVSRAPIEQLLAYRDRMGWSFEWVSSSDSDFNFDFGVSASSESPREALLEANELGALKQLADDPALRERLPLVASRNASASGTDLDGYFAEGHGFSTFAREGDSIYHCYSTYARGTEFLMTNYAILDHAPKGRDEGDQPMGWLHRHDEYPTEPSGR
jgi:predicted dithiol-disulfide oxidoreductase (DUF899 family)